MPEPASPTTPQPAPGRAPSRAPGHAPGRAAATPFRIQTILVPTDFSPCADAAVDLALTIARPSGAAVHLLHVIEPVEGDVYSPLRYAPETRVRPATPETVVYDHLQTVVASHAARGVALEAASRRARAVGPALVHYAEQEGVDLVVMGTHGRRGMQRLLLGSVAERVVRTAPCSVVTVRAPAGAEATAEATAEAGAEATAAPDRRIRRILVPVDFSDASGPLLDAARSLAAALGAGVDVLHVVEPLPYVGIFTGIMTAYDLVPDLGNQARSRLQRLWDDAQRRAVDGRDVAATLHVEDGHAPVGIADAAERLGADLVVIASEGRTGVERFLLGSVTERVVRTVGCPVLTLKRPGTGAAAAA